MRSVAVAVAVGDRYRVTRLGKFIIELISPFIGYGFTKGKINIGLFSPAIHYLLTLLNRPGEAVAVLKTPLSQFIFFPIF